MFAAGLLSTALVVASRTVAKAINNHSVAMTGFFAQPGSELAMVDLEQLVADYAEKGIEDVDLGDMVLEDDLELV